MPADPGTGTRRGIPPPPRAKPKKTKVASIRAIVPGFEIPPPPRVVSRPDTQDRAAVVRTKNVERGAKPSGGMGRKEAAEVRTATTRAIAKPTGDHVKALQATLRKQGFNIKVDGIWGPRSASAFARIAGPVNRAERKDFERKVRLVLSNPLDYDDQEKVDFFGFEGAQAIDGVIKAQFRATEDALGHTAKPLEERLNIEVNEETRRRRAMTLGTAGVVDTGPTTVNVPNAAAKLQSEEIAWENVLAAELDPYTSAAPKLNAGLRFVVEELTGLASIKRAIEAGYVTPELLINVASMAPPIRGPKAAIAAARALAEGGSVATARAAARVAIKEPGPIATAMGIRQAAGTKPLSAAHGRALEGLKNANAAVAMVKQERKALPRNASPARIKAAEKQIAVAGAERSRQVQEELYTRMQATLPNKAIPKTDERFVGRQAVARSLVKKLKGKRGALPDTVQTETAVMNQMTFLDALADEGAWGRMWYENSSKAILDLAEGDPEKATKFAQLIAIYSPQQPIIGNTSLAIRAWNEFSSAAAQFADEGRITTGQKWQQEAAQKVMAGKGDWDGRKTNNFYVNFLEDIHPERYREEVAKGIATDFKEGIRPDGVTIDMWMARAFGYDSDDVTKNARYDFMEGIVETLAKERGWKPKQMQAAIWTAIKQHSDDSAANIDFSQGLARHFGQFNFEAVPGQVAKGTSSYSDWPLEAQHLFMEQNAALVDDFLETIGLLSRHSEMGAGIYNGPSGLEFNPAAAARFVTSAAPRVGNKVSYRVHETERAAIEEAAAAIGRALQQDSVGWMRPMAAVSPGHADTAQIILGRTGTTAEAQALFLGLQRHGTFAVMHSPDGFLVRNIDESIPNITRGKRRTGFDEISRQVADDVFPDTDVDLKMMASDGGLVESGYAGQVTDARNAGGGGGAGRFQQAADLLAREAADLRGRYAEAFPARDTPLAERDALASAQVWQEEIQQAIVTERSTLAKIDARFRGLASGTGLSAGIPIPGLSRLEAMDPLITFGLRDLDAPYKPRVIKAGDLEAQIFNPRSRTGMLQAGARMIDQASRAIDTDRFRDIPGIRLMTETERAVKSVGRGVRMNLERGKGAVARDLKKVFEIEADSDEDVANFWYAQLPRSHRNAEGLRLIRGKQEEELQRILSGDAERQALADIEEIKATARNDTMTGSEAGLLMTEAEDLKKFISDLPNRVDDITASMARLDQVIASAPAVRNDVIDSMRALSKRREGTLMKAGRLNPEEALNREGMVARWVGLEPDGTEAYVGHRHPRPETFAGSYSSGRGVGKVKGPAGVQQANRLSLATTGRLKASTHITPHDWHASQQYEVALQARDDLAAIGTKYTPGMHIPKGSAVINPKGRLIPLHWKTDELAQFGENVDDVEELRLLAAEQVNSYMAIDTPEDPNAVARLKQTALNEGVDWEELRVVPKRLVDRYYKQFRGPGAKGKGWTAYDMAVDAAAANIIFFRIGYIPKAWMQNLIMSMPHQGIFFPINAARAGQAMRHPELLEALRAEIGHSSASAALAREAGTAVLGRGASAIGKVADEPARIAALMHEMAAFGVISKTNPLLTQRDVDRMIRVLTEEKQQPLLNDIRWHGTEAMGDFTRLTPQQARIARRMLIIPGWLMAGSRYPVHFALTHPMRSALMAYVALGEPLAPDELRFNKPVWEYFSGERWLRGIDTPWGRMRTSSLNPVSTPWEIAQALYGSARGKENPFDLAGETAWDYANPIVSVIGAALHGEAGDFLGLEGWERVGKRLAPNLDLILDMIMGPEPTSSYPGDTSRLGRLRREIGILPIPAGSLEEDTGGGGGGGSGSIFDDDGGGGGSIFDDDTGGSSDSIFDD